MRLSILFSTLLFVAAPGFAAAPAAAPGNAEQATAFVQAFYDWYVKTEIDSDAALKKKPAYFSPELTKALKADEAAAAKSPGEIVGLDFDPFLNAQDVCKPYQAKAAKLDGKSYEVEIFDSCPEKGDTQPAVVAQLVRNGDSWMFIDFLYPAREGSPASDLLSVLKSLQQERDQPAH